MAGSKLAKRNDLSSLEPRWFAFYVFPNCEKIVYKYMINNGLQAFLPFKKEAHQWSDRRKLVETPLLSSYVFAKIKKDEYYKDVIQIDKIVKIVDIGGELFSIPEIEIDWLKKICVSGYRINSDSSDDIQQGDKAMVNTGPLIGLEGRVCNHLGKNKFAVEIILLKRLLLLEIEGGELTKI